MAAGEAVAKELASVSGQATAGTYPGAAAADADGANAAVAAKDKEDAAATFAKGVLPMITAFVMDGRPGEECDRATPTGLVLCLVVVVCLAAWACPHCCALSAVMRVMRARRLLW